jgi:alpha-ketoglutarate-dependent taurine dioxygenase
MARMRLLHQTLFDVSNCLHGSRLVYRGPSTRRTLITLPDAGRDVKSSSEMGRTSFIRHVPSKAPRLMEQLEDLIPETAGELERTPSPRKPLYDLSRTQRQSSLRHGVKPGMAANAVSKKLFEDDGSVNVNPIYLRDACDCPKCVDPSTRQRNYSFIDIPFHIKPVLKGVGENHTYHVSWEHDVPGFDKSHTSYFPASRIERLIETSDVERGNPRSSKLLKNQLWDKEAFTKHGCWIDYGDYMNDTSSLKSAVGALRRDGLIFVKNVPPEASSVGKVGERIGPLRNTFYGTTWDVRSVTDAKNVAYTSKYLGFHMDLLYMDSPPEFQLLHCIHNSCAGGESRFVDTYKAARILNEQAPEMALALRRTMVKYTYDNDGHYYTNSHKVFNTGPGKPVWLSDSAKIPESWRDFGSINWSPEFMDVPGIERMDEGRTRQFLAAARMFAEIMERDDLVYQVKMEEGTCVVFENRRVAHARNAFEMQSGERWLRGAYLDYDVFWSKYKVLGLAGN